ncbi:efflux RND transporter periplasmic adaptor subunit [Bowmanella sp. JS7-9]|uniref:Efflux RND transporter periplasmic adaptor subunit n=1 Tax=Pseudobowmanella zhangzhouensis TaxID=1537679 RepID=A0ABW1XL60_9ALTE|nr:efflux RND transporter periplasmic adaptor subunit [Bowmanella sp. JS7-9]
MNVFEFPLKKSVRAALVLLSVATLMACQPASTESQTAAQPTLVKLATVTNLQASKQFEFPSEVSAVKTVDVRFEVTGRLIEEHLRAGTQVKKGDLLARLDPEPFERKVKEEQTRVAQADRELARVKSLVSQGLLPQSALDSAQTADELAVLALSKARQDLDYSRLHAPFDGQIAERLVDNDSYVRAGDTIARLQDRSQIYFNIYVPERLFTLHAGKQQVTAKAAILAQPDTWFDVQYVEHAAQPDPITQTYKVVFALPAESGFSVTPGARAVVKVNVNDGQTMANKVVPFTALMAEGDGFVVWRYVPARKQVEKVPVKVLSMRDGIAFVEGSLAADEQVVAAGVSKMRDDITVIRFVAER